jgi:hypothetical protein
MYFGMDRMNGKKINGACRTCERAWKSKIGEQFAIPQTLGRSKCAELREIQQTQSRKLKVGGNQDTGDFFLRIFFSGGDGHLDNTGRRDRPVISLGRRPLEHQCSNYMLAN